MEETEEGSDFEDTSSSSSEEEMVPRAGAGFESRAAQSRLFASARSAWLESGKSIKSRGEYLSTLEKRRQLMTSVEYLRIYGDLVEMGRDCIPWLLEGCEAWPVCGELRLRLVAHQFAQGDEDGARKSIEQCLSTAGLVVPTGSRCWTAARAFAKDVGDQELEVKLEKRQATTQLLGGALTDERKEFETRVASAAATNDDEGAVEAWIEYAEYEKKEARRAAVVYERAVAALEDREEFAERSLRVRIWEHYAFFQPEVASRAMLRLSPEATPALQILAIRSAERDPRLRSIPMPEIVTLDTLLARYDAYRRRGWESSCFSETVRAASDAGLPTFEIRRSHALSGDTPTIRRERWKQMILEEDTVEVVEAAAASSVSDGDLVEARRLYRIAATRHGAVRAYRDFERDRGTLQDNLDADYKWYKSQQQQRKKPMKRPRPRKSEEESPKKSPQAERIYRTVYVSELSKEITEADLSNFFSTRCGEVKLARVLLDKKTRASRGAGFVEFKEKEAVDSAVALTDFQPIGENCVVKRSSFLAPDPLPSPPKKKKKLNSAPLVPRVFAAKKNRLPKKKIDTAATTAPPPAATSDISSHNLLTTNDAFRAAFIK